MPICIWCRLHCRRQSSKNGERSLHLTRTLKEFCHDISHETHAQPHLPSICTMQSDDESTVASDEEEALLTENAATPKEHAYLPGTSHPLCPEVLQRNRPCRSQTIKQSPFTELAILEIPGVVIFPGSTLPIRLHNPSWIRYIGERIEESRNGGTAEVRIGILTQQADVAAPQGRQRRSWMRTGLDGRRSAILRRLLQEDQLLGESSEEEASETPQDTTMNSSKDPIVGRYGTVVTIANTHEDSLGEEMTDRNLARPRNGGSRVWRRYSTDRQQLVFTAVGT